MSTIERAREFCKSKEVSTVDANNYADFRDAEVEGYRAALKELVEALEREDARYIPNMGWVGEGYANLHREALARANELLKD